MKKDSVDTKIKRRECAKLKGGENDMTKEAIDKLRAEMGEKTNNEYVQYIGQHLIDYTKEHPRYAKKIMKEGKTVEGSLKYMESIAKSKKGNSNMAMLTPKEGFKAVMDYFGIEESNHKPNQKKRKIDISLDDLL